MAGELQAALSSLDLSDPPANVAAIKNAVIRQLHLADPGATIRTTEYFNHTFAPDIVLSWPSEGSAERRVYLRPDVRPQSLSEDLLHVSATMPILIPLAADATPDSESVEPLRSSAASTNTLITGAAALDEVSNSAEGATASLVRHSFVRGGRGYVDAPSIRRALSSVERAFEAAQLAEPETVREAVDASESILDLPRSGIVSRFLQAVWVASGASGSTFPGGTGATGALDVESLQLLLDTESLVDASFWSRVARNISLEKLAALRVSSSNEAFQSLVSAALPHLRARGGVITQATSVEVPAAGSEASSASRIRWSAADGALRLQGSNFRAYFPVRPLSDFSVDEPPQPGTAATVSEVFRRLPDNVGVSHLTFESQAGSQMHWEGVAPARALDDDLLSALTRDSEELALVTSASIRVTSSQDLRCNFVTGRLVGRTNSRFYVSHLLSVGLLTLFNVPAVDREAIGELAPTIRPLEEDELGLAAEDRRSPNSSVEQQAD